MKYFTLFIGILITSLCFCQDFSKAKDFDKKDETLLPTLKDNIFKIAPFQLLNTSNPGFTIGYERGLNNRISADFTIAYLQKASGFYNSSIDNTGGYRFAVEGKYYTQGRRYGNYLGLEFDYINNGVNQSETIREQSIDENGNRIESRRTNNYTIDKKISSVNLKVGKQINLLSSFTIDMFIGIGVRFKNAKEVGRETVDEPEGDDFTGLGALLSLIKQHERVGKYSTISMPLNFKLGYIF